MLDNEILQDTNIKDHIETIAYRILPPVVYIIPESRRGPGIGNIHIPTARAVSRYSSEEYGGCYQLQLDIHDASEWRVGALLANDEFSLRVIAAIVRWLADYRFGSNGQPLKTNHASLADWTITDAVAIWHGYRYGVPGVSPDAAGFASLADFQNRNVGLEEFLTSIVRGSGAYESASNSVPIFEMYFQWR